MKQSSSSSVESCCANLKMTKALRYVEKLKTVKTKDYSEAWKECIFSAGLIFSNYLASYAILSNLMFILRNDADFSIARAASTYYMQDCFTALMSIFWLFIADAYIGKYIVINISTIIYIIGLGLFTLLASLKVTSLFYYITFLFIATGTGGLLLSLDIFGQEQISTYYEGKKSADILYNIWWYTPKFLGGTTGSFLVAFVEKKGTWFSVGWITCGVISVTWLAFLSGTKFYRKKNEKPGSALTRLGRVLKAVCYKRPHPNHANHGQNLGHNVNHLPQIRCQRFLDRAIGRCQEMDVVDVKILFGMFPIWITFLAYGLHLTTPYAFFFEQAYNMDRRLYSNINLPVTSLSGFTGASKLATKYLCLPLVKKLIKQKKESNNISPKARIWVGMFFHTFSCIVAALVERKRLNIYQKHEADIVDDIVPMSVFWLVPQFALIGVMDGLIYDGITDFFKKHVSDSLIMFEPTYWESVYLVGCIFGALLVRTTSNVTGWFQGTVNTSRFDLYFWELSVISGVFWVLFTIVSTTYRQPPSPVQTQGTSDLERATSSPPSQGETREDQGSINPESFLPNSISQSPQFANTIHQFDSQVPPFIPQTTSLTQTEVEEVPNSVQGLISVNDTLEKEVDVALILQEKDMNDQLHQQEEVPDSTQGPISTNDTLEKEVDAGVMLEEKDHE